jgi:hypothetical protein
MKRFLRNIAIAMTLLLAAAWAVDRAMTHVFRAGKGTKAQWVSNMRGQHYDLAIIGSSRAWWNIDMHAINRACGLRTVNLAGNHYRSQEILLYLRIFLANGNTADRILLQVDHNSLSAAHGESSSAQYEIVPFLDDSVVRAHFDGRSPEWEVLCRLPLWRYMKCNFIWGPEEFVATASGFRKPLFDSTGTFMHDARFKGPENFRMQWTGHRIDPDLRQIIDLCNERGILLECFSTPYLNITAPKEDLDAPRRVLAETGLPFHDFSNRLNGKKYFNDHRHVSIEGGARFTAMLIDEVICPAIGSHVPAVAPK